MESNPDSNHASTPFGQLVPLRTRDEVRASTETNQAYVIEIPARLAGAVKDVIQDFVPEFKMASISHLRRVVQFRFLPRHLQSRFAPPARVPRGDEDAAPIALSPHFIPLPISPTNSESDKTTAQSSSGPNSPSFLTSFPRSGIARDTIQRETSLISSPPSPLIPFSPLLGDANDLPAHAKILDTVRYFVLCPTHCISHAELLEVLRNHPPINTISTMPRIFTVEVPSMAPTSAEQSEDWTTRYWPIAFKNTNPYGPHPSLVGRNAAEIQDEAATLLEVANKAGFEISKLGIGERFGCVVVDRTSGTNEIIAVAGDCRWRSPTGTAEAHTGGGNVMAHAVQRVIAMVSKKRLRKAGSNARLLDRPLFADEPLTDVEKPYYEKDNMVANGYLCVDLDIYLTHEPCVMCSMAIVHSRFKRCVFANRMPLTGGMTADMIGNVNNPGEGLQHGMFWRPSQLNWKFLAWEWKSEQPSGESTVDANVHA